MGPRSTRVSTSRTKGISGTARCRCWRGGCPSATSGPTIPGRYYWCALFCLIFGRRNLSLRLAMLALRVVTLALLAGLIHHATGEPFRDRLVDGRAGACSRIWYKSAEGLSPVMAVAVAAALLDDFQPARQAVAGAFAGLSLVFGLNLALYNATALAAASLFALMRTGPEPLSPAWLAAGLLAGLAPAVFLFATASGLWTAYVRRKIPAGVSPGHDEPFAAHSVAVESDAAAGRRSVRICACRQGGLHGTSAVLRRGADVATGGRLSRRALGAGGDGDGMRRRLLHALFDEQGRSRASLPRMAAVRPRHRQPCARWWPRRRRRILCGRPPRSPACTNQSTNARYAVDTRSPSRGIRREPIAGCPHRR